MAHTGIGMYDEMYLELEDIQSSIDQLGQEEDLEERESQICQLLQTLGRDREYEPSAFPMFRSIVWMRMADLSHAYYKKLSPGDPPLLLVNEFMAESIRLLEGTFLQHTGVPDHIWRHAHLLWSMGYVMESIEKFEESARYWLRADSNFGHLSRGRISKLESVKTFIDSIQSFLLAVNECKRALLWSERSHARDILFLVTSEEERDRHVDFDVDDEKAWAEVEGISRDMGAETVILVICHLRSGGSLVSNGVASYLLHDGELVGHSRQWEFEACAPSTLLERVNKDNADSALRDYYNVVVKPFESQLESIRPKRLIFVPNEDLCLVPFGAMIDEDDNYLIQRYATATVSSMRLLNHCNRRRKILQREQSSLSSLVVSNPSRDLYFATMEADMVETFLRRANADTVVNLLRGTGATKQSVLRHLPESRWIHIASHGKVSSQFPEGALVLAMPEEEQEQLKSSIDDAAEFEVCLTRAFAAAADSGSLLTGDEVVELAAETLLQASAVVLSACSSGHGRIFAEGILALPRSFHIAGVPSVVISLWDVKDDSTRVLMETMYGNLVRGMDVASALQEAVMEMIEARDGYNTKKYDIRHWAPFFVSGTPLTTF